MSEEAEQFLTLAQRVQEAAPALTAIQAAVLVALRLDIARDSRTFARLLDIEHALVLREVNAFSEHSGLLHIEKRDDRTMRTYFAPGEDAERLFKSAGI